MNELKSFKLNEVKHYYDKSRFEFLHGMDNRISTERFFKKLHEFHLIASQEEMEELNKELREIYKRSKAETSAS